MILELSGNHKVEYFLDEEGQGELLIYHQGTPGAGPIDPMIRDAARKTGFKIAALIRPGYGDSTRMKGRCVADIAPLAGALATHLGHQRFVTVGWSGGGPHAIATTALLPDRCPGAISLSGVGPFGMDLDFLAGMGQGNIEEFGAAFAGEEALNTYLTDVAASFPSLTGENIVQSMTSLLPEADIALLNQGFGDVVAETFKWAVKNGVAGWFDDDMAFIKPWGFDLTTITNKIFVLQGSEDLMVPFAHGQWLASHIPAAVPRLIPGEGHLSVAVGELERALTDLRALLN